jgi:transposase InsO family protein
MTAMAYMAGTLMRLGGLGIHGIRTPVLAPQANAVAERMVRTFRRECLEHLIVLNEDQLLRILSEFVAYYNRDRPHRSLGLGTPEVRDRPKSAVLRCYPILGGLHHSYEWAA